MQAIVEQLLEQLRGIWRFRWQAMLAAWLVCIAGWLAVFAMPDQFEANARVFVDTRTALTPIIKDIAIGQDVNAQLNFVQSALLERPQLEKVAREAELDPSSTTPEARAALISRLRERIDLNVVGPGRGEAGGTIYTLRYTDTNRDRSLRVVDTLLNTFVEDTLGGKRSGSEAAQRFLEQQIQEYEARLRESEQRLADFKRENVGMMPGAEGDYFSRLQNEIDAEKKAQAALSIAMSRRSEIERQLRGETPYAPVGGVADSNSRPGPNGSAQDTQSRIKETQARLDELLLRFTEKHPDVIATRETLEVLKRRRATELEALQRGDPGAAASLGASINPVYQNIQMSLNEADVDIATLRREINDRQQKIAELRRMIDTVPKVEAEYAELNRDYETTKTQYAVLVDKLNKARIGDDAEATGSVRFEVIDPPNAKFEPVAPNRLRLVFLVLIAGIGLGGGVAFLMHQLKPVFTNSRSLTELTGLPVLGVVSTTWLGKHKVEQRRAYALYASAATALVVMCVLTARFHESGAQWIQQLLGRVSSV